jgi:hypothetical protein
MKMKNILLLISIITGTLHTYFDIEQLNEIHNGTILSSQDRIDCLYQLMKDIHELFTFYNIQY